MGKFIHNPQTDSNIGSESIYLPNVDLRDFSIIDREHAKNLVLQILKEQNLIKQSLSDDVTLEQGSVIIRLPHEIQSLSLPVREQILRKLTKHWEEIASTNRHWGSALNAQWT